MDKELVVCTLLSGIVGSIITLLVNKFTQTTSERKSKAIELVDKVNENFILIEDLSNNNVISEELIKSYYKKYLKHIGLMESLSSLYFSGKVTKSTTSYIKYLDIVYLIWESELIAKKIDGISKEIEEETNKIFSLEAEGSVLLSGMDEEAVKRIINEQAEIAASKKTISYLNDRNDGLNESIIELRFRIKKIMGVDILLSKAAIIKVKGEKEALVKLIRNDYKLPNRIATVFGK